MAPRLRALLGLAGLLLAGAGCTAPAAGTAGTGAPSIAVPPSVSAPAVPLTARSSDPSTPATPAVVTRPAATLTPGTSTAGSAGSGAAAALAGLPVKGRAPETGYTREQFGQAWTDDNDEDGGHNGCDTRNDILRRDLTQLTLKPSSQGCVVLTGTLDDPYTGTVIAFRRGETTSDQVQIDHLVALSNAWQTGAQQLTPRARQNLGNDPLNLLAVQGEINQQKGNGDAASWLPPNKAFRCTYVSRQIAVKQRYGLWLTPAEKDAMTRILAGCPGQALPSEDSAAVRTPELP